jgi:hypothetical protein
MKITNAGNPLESKVINLTSVNFNKAGKAKVGTLLNPSLYPSLVSFGTNRWKKAAVAEADATGMPTKVIALFGNDFPNKLNVSSTKDLETVLAEVAASSTIDADIKAYAAVNAGKTTSGVSSGNIRTAFTALGVKLDPNNVYLSCMLQAIATVNTHTYLSSTQILTADKSSTYDWYWNYTKDFTCQLIY